MKKNANKITDLKIAEYFQQLISQIKPMNKISKNIESTIVERLSSHLLWLESSGKKGRRFQANNENFTGFDFSHRDLRQAEFKTCVLDYCNFYNADLGSSALLWSCSIKKSLFIMTKLENSQLVECEIENSNFRGAKFIDASITGTVSFKLKSSSTNNDFSDCIFKSSIFNKFSFLGAKIKGTKLDGVSFRECDLSMLDFTITDIVSSLDMIKCKNINMKLSSKLIEGSVIVECDLTDASFEGSLAKGTDFSKSNLTRTNFRNADLSESRLNMIVGTNMDFYNADINSSEMRLSSFRSANFLRTRLDKSDLSGSNLYLASINQTTIKNLANFSGCIWSSGKRCKTPSVGICHEEN